MKIKELSKDERYIAIQLARKIFKETKNSTYSHKGFRTFYNFTSFLNRNEIYKIYGLFNENILLGMIATDDTKNSIKLFFVDSSYQGKGYGKLLVEYILKNNDNEYITVNSSKYAVPIYEKLGFEIIEEEQKKDGILFTPMRKLNRGR